MSARRHPKRPHDARSLGREVVVYYPFHPLFGRSAVVVADQLHNGVRHLTLSADAESSFLVPAWMIEPDAASIKIVDLPRLSVVRLLELKAFLDSGLTSAPQEVDPEGGADDQG
jgi:hypothetical protein